MMNPKSVAVIGASARSGSVGGAVMRNMREAYKGSLIPVNPKADEIMGFKVCSSVEQLPEGVDLAVIAVPPAAVLPAVTELCRKKCGGIAVITAGFKEVDEAGAKLEKAITAAVQAAGVPLVGPNCLGVINTGVGMNASFATKSPSKGSIGFASQSGALGTSVLDVADGRNLGFSSFISFGNKADVTEIDILNYLAEDPNTKVILMYLEEIIDAQLFIETSRRITMQQKKPVLVIKSGVSAEGAKAASSHTGSLAGSDASYSAIFEQGGVIRASNIQQLFDYAAAFSTQPMPRGRNLAIITNAGGPGIITTDAAVRNGLKLAHISEETIQNLIPEMPDTAALHNPIDVIGDATSQRYQAAMKHVLADPGVDSAIVILTPQAMTDIPEIAKIIPPTAQSSGKPVVASFMGMVDVMPGVKFLQTHDVPNYTFPEDGVESLAAMIKFQERINRLSPRRYVQFEAKTQIAKDCIADALKSKSEHLMHENEANRVLEAYGFPLLRSQVVSDKKQIKDAADKIGFPLVMKIVSPQIIHKSDAGGVKVGISNQAEAEAAYDTIIANAKKYDPKATIEGIYMVQMAGKGVEVILGATRDPKFGPLIMFGLGGIMVEVMKDVTFRLAPMWESSAANMISSIRAFDVLKGVRGAKPSDIGKIKECILRLSQMLVDNPEIKELDINPMIVLPEGEGAVVADCRIILKK
jgi:acetyltransferase